MYIKGDRFFRNKMKNSLITKMKSTDVMSVNIYWLVGYTKSLFDISTTVLDEVALFEMTLLSLVSSPP